MGGKIAGRTAHSSSRRGKDKNLPRKMKRARGIKAMAAQAHASFREKAVGCKDRDHGKVGCSLRCIVVLYLARAARCRLVA